MSFLTRFQLWFRQWRRRRVAKNKMGALREFVYLDEVSVYSLMASRLGPIATEFTDTETNSLQSEVGSSIGAGVGIAKADVNSRILNSQTNGTQVLRKSIIQTAFKDLYEYEIDSLSIKPASSVLTSPKIFSMNDLLVAIQSSVDGYWIINPEKLSRGELCELEVQLEADPIFRVNAVASAILEILEEDAEAFGLDANGDLNQMKSVGRILEKLLGGLVPIRGKAIDYCVVELEGKEWIVNRKLFQDLPSTDQPVTYPVFIVGVAEQALFWKDLRRILFSNARYRVLCRIGQTGLQTSWTPVKLAHVLESVVPGFTSQINSVGSSALTSMIDSNKATQGTVLKQQLMHDALLSYAELITNHFQIDLAQPDKDQIKLLAAQHCVSFGTQKARREAFESLTTHLIENFEIKVEPLIFAQYRAVALVDAGLDLTGKPIPLASADNIVSPTVSHDRFIDSEFVAIYW